MKIILLSFAFSPVLFSTMAQASFPKIASYCDCYQFQSASLPVFARSQNGKLLANYKTHDFQNCVDIRIDQNSRGEISSIQIGRGTYPLKELSPGPVYFGVRKKIAHSMEIADFDPQRGGILRFHYLKGFRMTEAMDDDFSIREPAKGHFPFTKKRPRTPAELRQILSGPQWESVEVEILKSASGEWSVVDSNRHVIHEILALMTGKSALGMGVVGGISEMVFSSLPDQTGFEKLQCRKSWGN